MRIVFLLAAVLAISVSCGPSDGPYKDEYNNGQVKEEGAYRDGEKSGKWIYYWRNGNVQTVGYYTDGEPSGRWTYYDENRNQIAQGTYRDGKMWEGTFVRYIMGTKKFMTVEGGKQKGSD